MSDDYGYINARIRAMKSFLLKEDDYLEALRQRSPDEFISFLSSQSSYGNDIRLMPAEQSAGHICDETLKLNLCRIFRKIVKFCEGEPRTLILFLLFSWDIYNLKTIMRGIVGLKGKNEIIQALIPAGRWDLEILSRLSESKDLKSLSSSLAASANDDLESQIAKVIGDSKDTPLGVLENLLQEAYFRKAQEYLSPKNGNAHIVLEYLSLESDFLNILSVLRKIQNPDLEVWFIPGGKIKREFLLDLIILKSVEDVLKNFEHSYYVWLSQEGLTLYRRTQRLSSIERLFEKRLFSFCINLYITGNPLSIGIPLAFINFKKNEINNLRLISKAIRFQIPEELVKEELIYV